MELSEIFVIFDMEWTSWEGAWQRNWSGPGEHREIVNIGAVLVLNRQLLAEIGSLNLVVKPKENPELSEYFIDLTGITQRQVDEEGIEPEMALKIFGNFIQNYQVLSWGTDEDVLKENCQLRSIEFPFDRSQFDDARKIFKAAGIDTKGYHSSTIIKVFGQPAIRQGHMGLHDARTVMDALNELR